VSPLINLANQLAEATRPRVVGQMSELIKECPHKNFEGWKNGIFKIPKIMDMIRNFSEALERMKMS